MENSKFLFFNIIFEYKKNIFQYREFFDFSDNDDLIKYINQFYSKYKELFINNYIGNFKELRLEDISIDPSLNNNGISSPLLDALAISVKLAKHNGLINNSEKEIQFLYEFTEYYKLFLTEIKNDLHLLLIIFSNLSNITKKHNSILKIRNFLKKLNNKYQLAISITNQNINALLSSFIPTFYHTFLNHQFLIEKKDDRMSILNKYINLLKTIKLGKETYKKQKCFCLMYENEYYYTISGYDFDYTEVQLKEVNQIGIDLNKCFQNYKFHYCRINDFTLSYGITPKTNKFIQYRYPVPHFIAINKHFPSIGLQYSCCERKIFSYLINYNMKLEIYCKYAPCKKCIPALKDEKKFRQGNLSFDYFYKDFPTFKTLYKWKIKHNIKIYDTKKLIVYHG